MQNQVLIIYLLILQFLPLFFHIINELLIKIFVVIVNLELGLMKMCYLMGMGNLSYYYLCYLYCYYCYYCYCYYLIEFVINLGLFLILMFSYLLNNLNLHINLVNYFVIGLILLILLILLNLFDFFMLLNSMTFFIILMVVRLLLF